MKRWGRVLIAVLLVIGSAIPAVTAASAKPVRGGVLRLALDSEVLTLDPAFCQTEQDRAITTALYDSLMTYRPDTGALAFGLARTAQISDNGRVLRIGLRKGVRFHNGRELVASDVKFSFDRVADPRAASPGRTLLADVEGSKPPEGVSYTGLSGIKVIDDYTLQITFAKPSIYFLSILAEPVLSIVPSDEVQKSGSDFGKRPCGTGRFKLGEFAPGSISLIRNERDWHDGPPYLNGLSWTLYEPQEAYEAFLAEKLDVTYLPPESLENLKALGKWDSFVQSWPLPITFYFGFNLRHAPFNKPEVRKALFTAFNPLSYIRVRGGDGVIANGILPPSIGGHDPGRKRLETNIEAARKLLAQAGYPEGKGFPVIGLYGGSEGGLQKRLLELVKKDFESLGLTVEVHQVPPARYEDSVKRDADIFSYGWSSDYPDPHDFLNSLFSTDRQGTTNLTGYSNPKVDDLLVKARAERDPGKRAGMYRQIENLVMQDLPVIPVFHPVIFRVHQPFVKGCAVHPVVPFFYESIWLDKH